MSKEKFTPWPWNAPEWGNLKGAVVAKDGQMVCDPSGAGRYEDEMDANARLIAAAPEMYELLEFIYNYFAINGFLNDRMTTKISKLLKKVRGEK